MCVIRKLCGQLTCGSEGEAGALRRLHPPAEDAACLRGVTEYGLGMPSATASKPVASRGHRTSGRKLTGAEIRSRFEQVELATVSALRALQMDVEGDEGTPSATVLKRARAGLR
jgi:hypothetical protein